MKINRAVFSFVEHHLDQLWLLSPAMARLLWNRIPQLEKACFEAEIDLESLNDDDSSFEDFIERKEGVGILNINGVLSKHAMPSREFFGGGPITYPEIVQGVKALAEDESVNEILLKIESPGGGFFGLKDAADAIFEARSKKRITAYALDRCSSAAYWLASQAHRIVANKTAELPSIGNFAMLVDTQKQDEMRGLEYVLISSGGVKGKGADGKVDAELIDDIQRQVDDVQNRYFNPDIVRGRADKLSLVDVEALATGQEFFAPECLELDVIDEISSFDQALNNLMPNEPSAQFHVHMSPTAFEPSTKVRNHLSRADLQEIENYSQEIPRFHTPVLKVQSKPKENNPMTPEMKDLYIKAGAPATGTDEENQMWALEEIEALNETKAGLSTEIDRLRPIAKVGEAAKQAAIDEAIIEGKRAKGEDFDEESWQKRLSGQDLDSIIEMKIVWKELADSNLTEGRKVKSKAEDSDADVIIPSDDLGDIAYKVR